MTAHLAIESVAPLPKGWRVVPFRRVAQERGVRNVELREPSLSLSSTGSLYDRTEETDRQFASEQSSRNAWVVHPGDLVVNPMWLLGGAIGVSDRRGAVSPDYRVYQLSEVLHPRFVHHLLRSPMYRDQFRLYMRAETTFDRRVAKDDFGEMPLLVPPVRMQGRIAHYLDAETARIDGLVESKRRIADMLAERLRATIAEAVLPLRPGADWRRLKLKYVAALESGDMITSDSINEAGDYPVYGGNGLRGYTTAYNYSGSFVLLGRQGALCGNVNYATGRFWASEHAVVVRPNEGVEVSWLGELLRAMNLNQYSMSAAQPGLSIEHISSLSIPVPTIGEQRSIADALHQRSKHHESLTARLDAQVALLLERRQGLIAGAVTGQIEIPGVAA